MRVICGLGNPGPDYEMTRHNSGAMLVTELAKRHDSDYGWRAQKEALVYKTGDQVLVKPKDKFMNQSGEWVNWVLGYAANGAEIKNLWVVHDDLDILLGEYKIQFGVGPKDHGGINSIEAVLGTGDFWRVRLGIELPSRNRDIKKGEDFVLERFGLEEKNILDETIQKAIAELEQKS